MLSWTSRFFHTHFQAEAPMPDMLCKLEHAATRPTRNNSCSVRSGRKVQARHDNRASTDHPAGAAQVLAAGPDSWVHPASRKAKLWVNLLDLQTETGLTDAAVQHVALVCGPRCATPQDQRPALC